jgi:hypothetical protein
MDFMLYSRTLDYLYFLEFKTDVNLNNILAVFTLIIKGVDKKYQ